MNSLYNLLEDRRPGFIGPLHWLGNLKWFVEELTTEGSFAYCFFPQYIQFDSGSGWIGTLYGIHVGTANLADTREFNKTGVAIAPTSPNLLFTESDGSGMKYPEQCLVHSVIETEPAVTFLVEY